MERGIWHSELLFNLIPTDHDVTVYLPKIPEVLEKYFSMDEQFQPVGGSYYSGGQQDEQDESGWEVKDYIN